MEHDDLKPDEQIKYPHELPKAGWHPAVCAQIHNIGYQKFKEEVSNYRQVVLLFELAAKRSEGDYAGQPFLLSEKVSNVLSASDAKKKSNLTELLSGWMGRDMSATERAAFTLASQLNAPAFLNVKHETGKDGVVRAKIASIGPLPDGMTPLVPTVKETPKWILELKEKQVQKTVQAAPGTAPHTADDPDALPF